MPNKTATENQHEGESNSWTIPAFAMFVLAVVAFVILNPTPQRGAGSEPHQNVQARSMEVDLTCFAAGRDHKNDRGPCHIVEPGADPLSFSLNLLSETAGDEQEVRIGEVTLPIRHTETVDGGAPNPGTCVHVLGGGKVQCRLATALVP